MSPPENALVLCVDEKSQIQALDRTAPCLPMLPATPARMTHDYLRNGTTSLFAAFDLASGSVIAQHYRRHRRATKPSSPAQHHIKDSFLHQVLLAFRTHLGTHSVRWPMPRPWLPASRAGAQMHGIHEIFCGIPGASECPYGQCPGLLANSSAGIR
jgi:hypothetical protein